LLATAPGANLQVDALSVRPAFLRGLAKVSSASGKYCKKLFERPLFFFGAAADL
jgi:hypothetical protein